MTPPEAKNKNPRPASRRLLELLTVAACAACTGCMAPIDMVHRVSVDVAANPKDLRACVIEAIRGVDGVPGIDAPNSGFEQTVSFRTTLPEVSGEVEREGTDSLRVSIEVMSRVEPDNFWTFAQPRAKAIADAIGARCGAL